MGFKGGTALSHPQDSGGAGLLLSRLDPTVQLRQTNSSEPPRSCSWTELEKPKHRSLWSSAAPQVSKNRAQVSNLLLSPEPGFSSGRFSEMNTVKVLQSEKAKGTFVKRVQGQRELSDPGLQGLEELLSFMFQLLKLTQKLCALFQSVVPVRSRVLGWSHAPERKAEVFRVCFPRSAFLLRVSHVFIKKPPKPVFEIKTAADTQQEVTSRSPAPSSFIRLYVHLCFLFVALKSALYCLVKCDPAQGTNHSLALDRVVWTHRRAEKGPRPTAKGRRWFDPDE